MSGRRRVQPSVHPVMPAPRTAWPPTCADPKCGWQGEPNDEQSPYLDCAGVRARHQRTPVGAQ